MTADPPVPDASLPPDAGALARPTAEAAAGSAVSMSMGRQNLLALVAGLFAGVALLICLLLWQKVSGMQEQLARQSAEAQSQALEARALAKQAVALAQEATARASMQEARLSEVALQRGQLDELMQSLSRSRDENLVVDIDASLRLAQQQAQLTGSVAPLLAALQSAEQRIARAAQPQLVRLQRAMARDIDRIKASAVSDTPSLLVKLDELVRLADDLMLANTVAAITPAPKTALTQTLVSPGWWSGVAQLVFDEARKLVRVSRVEAPEAALLTPEQSFFLRENFKLKVLNARLGLLARQIESARADLSAAESTLKKYFDNRSRQTRAAMLLLQQVQVQLRTLQLPRIDDTLAVLSSFTAGR